MARLAPASYLNLDSFVLMNIFFAAARLTVTQLVTAGALGGLVIIAWSYSKWRTAVKVAFVIALIEGAIRKWILPQGQELVYFLKDIFLIGAYLRFFIGAPPDLRGWRLRIPTTVILLLCAMVAMSALNPAIGSPLMAIYGVKIYFMYLPLVFMMPYLFRTEEEMVRELTWFALLAIPISALGFLQFKSDAFSVLNVYAQGEYVETGAVGFGVGEKIRVTGTFSYITGHSTFVILFTALHFVLLSLKETKWKWVLLGVSLPMLAANTLMNGSRSSVVAIIFVVIGLGLAAASGRVGTDKRFLTILMVGGLFSVGATAYLFRNAWENWYARFESSGSTGEIKARTVDWAGTAFTMATKEGGFFGYGIGSTHPAVEALRRRFGIKAPKIMTPVYDNEIGQVMVELGVTGFAAWYFLRLVSVAACWIGYRRAPPGIVRTICLTTFLLQLPYIFMSVVLNHTANILLCGLTGLSLIPFLERVAVGNPSRGRLPSRHRFPGPAQESGPPHRVAYRRSDGPSEN